RIEIQNLHAIRIEPIFGNNVARKWRLSVRRIENRDRRSAAVVSLRKIALAFERRRYRDVVQPLRHQLALPFDSHKEEQLVAILVELSRNKRRAADVEAFGIVAIKILLPPVDIVPPGIGVEVLVAMEEVTRAVKILCTGLRDDLDLSARGTSEFRRLRVG